MEGIRRKCDFHHGIDVGADCFKGAGDASRIYDNMRRRISDEMNDKLMQPFREEEIWFVVKDMAHFKAPGVDGFPALWVKKGNFSLKLDMSKAYDWVKWDFLARTTIQLCFHVDWVALIMSCVASVSYAVEINRGFSTSFTPSRGLRQGDPLNPYLFLLCVEGYSAILDEAKAMDLIKEKVKYDKSLSYFGANVDECTGESVNIWNDPWILEPGDGKILSYADQVDRFLDILFAKTKPVDIMVWRHEGTSVYTVNSAYKLLLYEKLQNS
ncbi:reverse transcriptase [Gossypium australe]|uniref:Reverse transcriptase n=1 Tax=Gossypium australe TaxID=47621 RepID=A0A5B6WFK4_9ROSI|nr:reverse transcriptase [Gossypium australe]